MIFDPAYSPFDNIDPIPTMRRVSPDLIGWKRAPQPEFGRRTWMTPNGTLFTFPEDEPELVWALQGGQRGSPKSKIPDKNGSKPPVS